MNELYTIGHSIHSNNYFLELLTKYGINCLVDVRSNPYSKYAPQYNMNEIKRFLISNQIYYIFMGEEFGARRKDKSLFTNDYLDFDKVIPSSLFQKGIERIKNGLEKNLKIAFMCTEKDPLDCHRCILVARAFHDLEYNILNIREDGNCEPQSQIEKRLLDLYFPIKNQLSLIELEPKMDTPDLILEAYRLRNQEIAYREESSNEVIYDRVY
ncbi:MAG: DUF488 domain-containing protein [Firmicutes bacterium]|nr:DUF488 domain-containing protein [Bacillota bacterium]